MGSMFIPGFWGSVLTESDPVAHPILAMGDAEVMQMQLVRSQMGSASEGC